MFMKGLKKVNQRTKRAINNEIVFFVDVDNTLLDNDYIKDEIKKSLIKILGQREAEHFWLHHDQFRERKKLVDFPNIINEYCKEKHRETCQLLVTQIFNTIQFTHALFPSIKEVLKYLKTMGKVIIFSESDDDYQKVKIAKSGLEAQVDEVLLFDHKLDHLDEIIEHHKDSHLVFLDDKVDILNKIKETYPAVFTIEVCQGHYCTFDHKSHRKLDKKIYSMAELLNFTVDIFKTRKTKKIRKLTSLELAKFPENPIIFPRQENGWETWQTFNPGVILLNDKVHFIYRAIGEDGISRLGYAVSSDGFHIDERQPFPAYEHQTKSDSPPSTYNIFSFFSGGSFGGAEDPRLTRVDGEDVLYMTYTACDDGLRVALTSIKVDAFLKRNWKWKKQVLISPPGEVHKNWLIFPEKINGKYAILHSIKPNIQIEYVDNLEFDNTEYINSFHGGGPQKRCWDKWLRGAGAPPIKTSTGWLLFYHAMDNDWSKYKVGVMLLDLNDPTKVLYRAKEPVLEPSEDYENNGYKSGVVYASGVTVKDGNLLVYYGAADSYVGVAYVPLEEFLNALMQGKKPKLSVRQLKNKK